MNAKPLAIAIDGPAASGKSSVAKRVAATLGYIYVNTGAMYRAATWYALRNGIEPSDSTAVIALIQAAEIDCGLAGGEATIRIGGHDPAADLCGPEVNRHVSTVARIPEVRRILVARQRSYAADHDVVMEGRDIGTVVLADTPHKFYIDASPEVRAKRRAAQGLPDEIRARDHADSSRQDSPLAVAADATVIDSSELTLDQVVERVLRELAGRGITGA